MLEEYAQPQLSGFPKIGWLIGAVERFRIPPGGRWLSIGCGSAGTEIEASRHGFFSSMEALDVSSGSLDQARETARKAGVANIEFSLADFNNLILPPERYDVVLGIMSLHHVDRLPELFEQINRSLVPGGLFLTNEYVGPSRLQFTDLQLAIARELLEALPEIWRRDSQSGSVKTEASRLTIREWMSIDPSEAIRSDEILPEIEKRFDVLERHDFGGAILHPMLEGIVHNFSFQDPKDVGAIRLIATFESILTRLKVLPSDFTLVVARKHGSSGGLAPPKAAAEALAGAAVRISDQPPHLPPPLPRAYVDFRRAAHTSEVLRGFHPWDVDSRWLGESGELRLRVASGKLHFLLGAHSSSLGPGKRPFRIEVSLQASEGRDWSHLGDLTLSEPGIQEHVLSLGDDLLSRTLNREVRIRLRSDRTWSPKDFIPGAADTRILSVQIFRVAFEP